ncbi:hypothetical protein MishRS11D_45850 (plasmid) [Methylomagnum ishizawai]|nr:hypothetical protein MishRS11D_45850 [Methylomagnum ishizawai]
MLDELTPIKEQLVEALVSLPDTVTLPMEGALTRINLTKETQAEVSHLTHYWEFILDNYDTSVIALVGMVNAGKSAIGNLLLHCSESSVFQEAPIRETSEPSIARLDEKVILVDLPGLGSVLADEDDAVVKSYLRRANLLLIVISVDSPITKHLFEFLKTEISSTYLAQRIIFVLNKIDIWDNLPELHRKKELSRYVEFLTNGQPSLGFCGINALFDYEVPIMPISVKHARNNHSCQDIESLQNSIISLLCDSKNSTCIQAKEQLQISFSKHVYIANGYSGLQETLQKAEEQVEWVKTKLIEYVDTELSAFYTSIVELDKACWVAMEHLPKPDWFEKTFETSGLSSKKQKLRETREYYSEKMKEVFDRFNKNIALTTKNILIAAFGCASEIAIPAPSKTHEILDGLAYINWDIQDDIYFLDKSVSSSRINERTNQKLQDLEKEIGVLLDNYAIFDAITYSAYNKFSEEIKTLESLRNFMQGMSNIYTSLFS